MRKAINKHRRSVDWQASMARNHLRVRSPSTMTLLSSEVPLIMPSLIQTTSLYRLAKHCSSAEKKLLAMKKNEKPDKTSRLKEVFLGRSEASQFMEPFEERPKAKKKNEKHAY